ncbi:MAG TPA: nuclear transport factor 2 family protein [Jiangellales bacterium]|nr:nuclear transport factor 2 family protein [Jiangellales bacterium]
MTGSHDADPGAPKRVVNSVPSTKTGSGVTPREVTEQLYTAISRGDTATINELIHPHATLSVPGANPVSGTYHGTEGLMGFTQATAAIAPGGAHTDIIDIMAASGTRLSTASPAPPGPAGQT